jgi:valyl-tRNA synthetase
MDPPSSTENQYFDPVSGEPISKNAWKKLQKTGGVAKVKKPKEKVKDEKKEKKPGKDKPIEIQYTDNTALGDKKRVEDVFPPTYQPQYVESAWQSWWEKSGFYGADPLDLLTTESSSVLDKDKFVMVIPPPNVTGYLHLGHALTSAVEDALTRWHRMNGKITLWVPGTDHAGIATQSVVEKRLQKEEGLSRHDLGRDKFVDRVWEWKEKHGNRITQQIRSLGASCDWSREAFTMDENLSRAVTEAFCRFHDDGLLYRDTRLVNWSCSLRSAISEIEVDYIELEGRTFLSVPGHTLKDKYEFGMITSFAYKIDKGNESNNSDEEEIVVATTRLETMLGDTAVAVHPEDPRYKHLHGKFLLHPFVDRKIPIITDAELVDMSFGTGAVKITPAHDPNDFNCGKRNNLEFIVVLTQDGRIAPNGGIFANMMRYDARVAMEKALEEKGLYRGKEKNKMRLGLCSRSSDIIEPMLTPQWYVNCNSMADRAVQAVRSGDLTIVPSMHKETWFYWLENIRDWCISRQLWWGHRIPAYFAHIKDELPVLEKGNASNEERWFVARSMEEALQKASEKLNVPTTMIHLEQDDDVLDTWFSSGLFPFSVFGWPNDTPDFKAFYPTSLLETGLDILFFWVARMVMMGLHLTDTLPFTTVYLHAMVRDKNGKKMSKSLGNVIDPLEVINGCELSALLKKIDDGNLAEKEVSHEMRTIITIYMMMMRGKFRKKKRIEK